MGVWDERDIALGLRDKMAQMVAEIVSGAEGAIAEQADYDTADRVRAFIEADTDI